MTPTTSSPTLTLLMGRRHLFLTTTSVSGARHFPAAQSRFSMRPPFSVSASTMSGISATYYGLSVILNFVCVFTKLLSCSKTMLLMPRTLIAKNLGTYK